MDSFTVYGNTYEEDYMYKPALSFSGSRAAHKQYEQLIKTLRAYVLSSACEEASVHIYNSYEKGYTIYGGGFNNLTAKCMANYLAENDGTVNKDDFLFNSLLDVVPERIVLHCSISPKFFTTLKRVFDNVTYE